jgi:hypothetical protein
VVLRACLVLPLRYRASHAEAFIRSSAACFFAEELSDILHIGTQDFLRQLVQQNRIARELVSGLFLYAAIDPATCQRQRLIRRSAGPSPRLWMPPVCKCLPMR